jgi:hypothetical protein
MFTGANRLKIHHGAKTGLSSLRRSAMVQVQGRHFKPKPTGHRQLASQLILFAAADFNAKGVCLANAT